MAETDPLPDETDPLPTMRMQMRRFTRLTNAFSKKLENHIAAISLHFMHYNFVRIHQSLRVTPAMAAGVTHKLWSIEDIVALMDDVRIARSAERAEQEDWHGPTDRQSRNRGPRS